jgi:hypothetical protein
MKTNRLFIDCEFTSPELDANIISIGLVSEDGARNFYREIEDTWTVDECSWSELKQWIESFVQPVQIWGDGGVQKDFSALLYILGKSWPSNLERSSYRILHENMPSEMAYDYSIYFEDAFDRPDAKRHHALWDACLAKNAYHLARNQLKWKV